MEEQRSKGARWKEEIAQRSSMKTEGEQGKAGRKQEKLCEGEHDDLRRAGKQGNHRNKKKKKQWVQE